MIFLTVQNLGSAMSDVVVDAVIAEAVRNEWESFAGDLQSMSWLAMALGGICGSLLGGYALTDLQIDTIFVLFTVLPAIKLLSCGLVEENSVGSKALPQLSDLNGSHMVNGKSNDSLEESFLAKKSNISVLQEERRVKRTAKREQ